MAWAREALSQSSQVPRVFEAVEVRRGLPPSWQRADMLEVSEVERTRPEEPWLEEETLERYLGDVTARRPDQWAEPEADAAAQAACDAVAALRSPND